LLPLSATAGIICALGPAASAYKPGSDQRPTPDAMQVAARLNTAMKAICASNCPEVAVYRNATAPNVMLIVDPGQAKLVYSPQFFGNIYTSYGDNAIVGIMAHEMGHALDDTMGAAWIKSDWTPELRADSWAGCILAKIGLNGTDLDATLAALSKNPSPAHTGWDRRLPVLRTGHLQCGGASSKFDKRK